MNFVDEIKRFNKDRGLLNKPFMLINETRMQLEEVLEPYDVKVGLLVEDIIEEIDCTNVASIHEVIDSMADQVVVAIGTMLKYGYDPELVMLEVTKEINSRVGSIDDNGKFQKDKSPEAKANWYQADYTKCKDI